MLNARESVIIIAITAMLAILLSFARGFATFPFLFGAILLVFLVNILAKKITSFYLDSEIEIELWTMERYGFSLSSKFKKSFPAGIFFPIIVALVTIGRLVWFAPLVFEVKPKAYRAAKRHGLYSFSEMTEEHIGSIAAVGIIASLVFAFVGYLIGFSEFSRFSIYFALFNMIPFSDLDGNKIFFGNKILWSFLAALTLIGVCYTFFLV